MKVGSLFSGIGGFDLGLERAGGFQTAWFCEQDPYCTKVLNKHWPDVPVYPDITELKGSDVEPVDVLCGGFPCQDLSVAGKGAGLAGARSGLWSEYARLIGELRPQYVVVENVTALVDRGLYRVLADFAEAGFDAEWTCLRASDFGAPHPRDRFWLVAYPKSVDGRTRNILGAGNDRKAQEPVGGLSSLVGAAGWRPRGFWGASEPPSRLLDDGLSRGVAGVDARTEARSAEGVPVVWHGTDAQTLFDGEVGGQGTVLEAEVLQQGMSTASTVRPEFHQSPDPSFSVKQTSQGAVRAVRCDGPSARSSSRQGSDEQQSVEPRNAVRGLSQQAPRRGEAERTQRLKALGNALVPQIAEWLGHRILAYEAANAVEQAA